MDWCLAEQAIADVGQGVLLVSLCDGDPHRKLAAKAYLRLATGLASINPLRSRWLFAVQLQMIDDLINTY